MANVQLIRLQFMRLCNLLFVVLIFTVPRVLLGQDIAPPEDAPNPTAAETVSLAAILADPSSYDGRRIQTQGVLGIAFEGDALYLTREHREQHVFSNALWVNVGDEGWDLSRLAEVDGEYVTIEARVDAKNKGHLGLSQAALVEIGGIHVME